jgi:glyoxylase-like metal-dependent hydrolase (beta-lactamase superfamily II)
VAAAASHRSGEIADGVFRLGSEWVNWYACDTDGELTIVDCGFPGYAGDLDEDLRALGRSPDAVTAIVVTHYHVDHLGMAEAFRERTDAQVFVPAGDLEGAKSGKVPLPKGMIASHWHPNMVRYSSHAVMNGALRQPELEQAVAYRGGEILDVPARLKAIATPGHTGGHCCLFYEGAGVLFTGDALAGVDFFSRVQGPRALPFNEDHDLAARSLSALERVPADVVAFGHGDPFRGSAGRGDCEGVLVGAACGTEPAHSGIALSGAFRRFPSKAPRPSV